MTSKNIKMGEKLLFDFINSNIVFKLLFLFQFHEINNNNLDDEYPSDEISFARIAFGLEPDEDGLFTDPPNKSFLKMLHNLMEYMFKYDDFGPFIDEIKEQISSGIRYIDNKNDQIMVFLYNVMMTDKFITYEHFKNMDKFVGSNKTLYEIIKLYNTKNNKTMTIKKHIGSHKDQLVFLAEDEDGREWVIKWVDPLGQGSIDEEIKDIKRIVTEGGTTFNVSFDWEFYDKKVLVAEKLIPIDEYDNVTEIFSQILEFQLKYIHRFALHLDIKPDNIMKRYTPNGDHPKYFLIDMDLVKSVYSEGVFSRSHGTRLWAPNIHTRVRSTYIDDIKELFYTINALILRRLHILNKINVPDPITFIEIATEDDFNDRDVWNQVEKSMKVPVYQVAPNMWLLHEEIQLSPLVRNEKIYKELSDEAKKSKPKTKSSRLPPKVGHKIICLRCGKRNNTDNFMMVENSRKHFTFCDKKCQQVFYQFHK